MKNIDLNAGGFIGVLLAIAGVVTAAALTSGSENLGGRIGGFGAPALLFGGFGGNYLWDRFFRKPE